MPKPTARRFQPLMILIISVSFTCSSSVNCGLQGFVGALVRMSFGEPRQRLGPAERGAFAIGIARGLAPGGQQVDALLGLALLRASAVCMLMQLAQPLICEARIFTSSARLGSRLELMATEVPNQFFMSDGAAAKRSSFAVMVGFLLLVLVPTS